MIKNILQNKFVRIVDNILFTNNKSVSVTMESSLKKNKNHNTYTFSNTYKYIIHNITIVNGSSRLS